MIPLRIEGTTHKMIPPTGMEDTVRPLHIRVTDGCCVSRWEPTREELAVLMEGGSVELWVVGCQPPVNLVVAPHA